MSHPLSQKIVVLRRRARRLSAIYALSILAAVVLGVAALLGLLDFVLRFQDRGVRIIASLVALAATAWTFRRFVRDAFTVPLEDAHLAFRVQRRFPVLGDRLASAVEFLRHADDDPTAGSAALRRAVIAQTTADAQSIDFTAVLDRRPAFRAAAICAATCAVVGVLFLLNPAAGRIALVRLLNPFGATVWPQRTHLLVRDPVRRVARGQPLVIDVIDSRGARLPPEVRIHYRFEEPDEPPVEETEPMHYVDGVMRARRESVERPFSYRVEGGDDQMMTWIDVEVAEPPAVESLRIRLIPPAYTGWPPEPTERQIRALVGTRVEIAGMADKLLKSATLCMEGGPQIPAELGKDGYTFMIGGDAAPFVVEKSGSYWFALTDREDLDGGGDRWEIRAVPDAPPTVAVEQPTSNLFVTPEAVVPLRITAKDDLALRRIGISFSRSDAPAKQGAPSGEASAEPSKDEEPALTFWTGPDRPSPELGRDLNTAADGDRREVDCVWDLSALKLAPGAQVTFCATAADYRPQIGKSDLRRLTVITAEELQDRIAGREKLILAELERVLKSERNCREQVEASAGRLSEPSPLTQAEVDHLQALVQNQRETEQMLAGRKDGVAMHLVGLLADLKNNRVQANDVEARFASMLDEIQRLGRDHLVSIERGLVAAVKMVQVAAERTDASNTWRPEAAASLAEAMKHQDAVIAAIERMVGQLGQWDNTRRFPRELGQLLHDQQEVMRRTSEIGRRTLTQELRNLSSQDAAELKVVAGRQFELAQLLDRLLQEMDRAAADLQQTDPFTAKSLTDALEQSRSTALAGEMRHTGQWIEQNQIGQATAAQKQIGLALQRLLDTLASRPQASSPLSGRSLAQLQQDVKRLRDRQQEVLTETRRLDAIPRPNAGLPRSQALAVRELLKRQRAIRAEMDGAMRRFDASNAFHVALGNAASEMERAATALDGRQTGPAAQDPEQNAIGWLDAVAEALDVNARTDVAAAAPSADGDASDQASSGDAAAKLPELKLLRLMQQGINDRTVVLHQSLGSAARLNDEQIQGHAALAAEQGQLADSATGDAANQGGDHPLIAVAGRMRRAQQRMAKNDSGDATQQVQRQIVADLDRLIQESRSSTSKSATAGSPKAAASHAPPGDTGPQPPAGDAKKPTEDSTAAGAVRRAGEGAARRPDLDQVRSMMKRVWGELPEHAREKMQQFPVEEFPPKYEVLIEEYYRRLAEEEGKEQ